MMNKSKISKLIITLLIVVPLGLFYISIFLGRYPIEPLLVLKAFAAKIFHLDAWSAQIPDTINTVIFQVRLPRTLMAMLVGAALSVSGASFQGMFRNPLVSPDILGVSAAAGFGAALAILISGNTATIQLFAFIFGLVGVIMAYALSRVHKSTPILMLVLSGVVVSSLFSALISIAKYVADPFDKLPAITFWMMGSLSAISLKDLITVVPAIALGIIGLLMVRWRLNVLAMGDEEARSMGVKTEMLKGLVVFCATVVTASSVCVSGMIGWVGLVIPHVCRMIVGPDHKVLLPTTLSVGASYLLIIDNISRTAISAEIPLGILTAIIGAPFFGFLIRKTKGGWK